MSDLCPQCGNPAYLQSDQCNVIWHTGAKPFGTSVVQDIDAKLKHQTHLIEQLFALLDKREETDDGRVFHPNQLRSCRASDAEKLSKTLAELKRIER